MGIFWGKGVSQISAAEYAKSKQGRPICFDTSAMFYTCGCVDGKVYDYAVAVDIVMIAIGWGYLAKETPLIEVRLCTQVCEGAVTTINLLQPMSLYT